jgi:uncharacterized protein
VTVLDANVLLNAYDLKSPHYLSVEKWLRELIESGENIGLPWVTIWAFLRISTNHRLYERPLTSEEAVAIIEKLASRPGSILLEPGPRHLEILGRLMRENQAVGPLAMDAALAAIAIEHGARLASSDHDFRRFPEVRWVDPTSDH